LAENILGQDALDGLQGIMSEAANDPGLRSQMEAEVGEFVRKLPHDIRADVEDGILKAATTGDYPALVSEASRYLTARHAAERE
jgi:DNA repair protein SbcD/Mre11